MAWNLLTSVRRIRLMSLSVRAGKITLVRKPCKQRSHSVAVVWEKKWRVEWFEKGIRQFLPTLWSDGTCYWKKRNAAPTCQDLLC